jgi:hypothetical protein
MHVATKVVSSVVAIALLGAVAAIPTTTAAPKGESSAKKSPERGKSANDPTLLNRPTPDKIHRLIFTATLEGLYTDGVQNDIVDQVLLASPTPTNVPSGFSMHFIYGCPICMPAYDAFRVYRERRELSFRKKKKKTSNGERRCDTLGDGLSKEMRERILSENFDTRVVALAELTRTWLDRRFRSMRLTDAETSGWRDILQRGRKNGMQFLLYQVTGTKRKQNENVEEILAKAKLKNLLTACPFCDGATCAIDRSIESEFFQPAAKKKQKQKTKKKKKK